MTHPDCIHPQLLVKFTPIILHGGRLDTCLYEVYFPSAVGRKKEWQAHRLATLTNKVHDSARVSRLSLLSRTSALLISFQRDTTITLTIQLYCVGVTIFLIFVKVLTIIYKPHQVFVCIIITITATTSAYIIPRFPRCMIPIIAFFTQLSGSQLIICLNFIHKQVLHLF